jgi:hypothetical protein
MNNLSGRLLGTVFSLIGCGALFWPRLASAAPRILFVARGESANNTYELYTMSADGTDRRRVTTNTFSEWAPALAPDNYRVAYVRDDLASSNLFITSIDGMPPVRLSNTNAALCVQWADNHTLFFLARTQPDSGSQSTFRLWQIGTDGSGGALVFTNTFSDWSMGARAFSVRRETGTVYLSADVPGGSYESMIRFGAIGSLSPTGTVSTSSSYLDHYGPVVSPDGSQIAFCVDPQGSGGQHRLYVTSIGGGPGIRLSDVYCGNPSWSPDGAWLAFTHATGSTYGVSPYVGDIWRVSARGTNLLALTTNSPVAAKCAFPTVFEPPAITIAAPQVDSNEVVINWSGGANLLHTLQSATNCASGNWTAVPGAADLASTGATLTVTDGVAPAGPRFYRVVARPQWVASKK